MQKTKRPTLTFYLIFLPHLYSSMYGLEAIFSAVEWVLSSTMKALIDKGFAFNQLILHFHIT